MRTCTKCGVAKPLEEFYLRSKNSENRHAECKVCNDERNRKWRLENKDKKAVNAKRWKLLNPNKVRASNKKYVEEHKEKRQAYERAWRQANADKLRERDHKRRATKNNADGSFTKKEFGELCAEYSNVCVCCGKDLKLTVDHVVPLSRGGTNNIDNIQPLCLSCNSKKSVHTVDYRNVQISFV